MDIEQYNGAGLLNKIKQTQRQYDEACRIKEEVGIRLNKLLEQEKNEEQSCPL